MVLTVYRLTDRTGAYYLADLGGELAVGSADLGGRGVRGPHEAARWVGGRTITRLRGPLEGAAFTAMLAGRHPLSGRVLPGPRRHVRAFDLTFSAPKSASVLFALGPPEVAGAVVAAHRMAVDEAVGYLERRAVSVRRSSGDWRRVVPAKALAWAAFDHATSRALDPHLHTHVVVANVAHGGDGRWSALDGRGLYAHRGAAGSLYGAHLRWRLAATLGVRWEPRRNGGYEVAGIDPLLLGAFSSRAADIRVELAGRPPGSNRSSRVAWARTRDPKPDAAVRSGLAREWRARAAELGPDPWQSVARRSSQGPKVIDEHRFLSRLAASPHAVATRRDVVRAWADACPQGQAVRGVERSADWALGGPVGGVGVDEPVRPLSSVTVPRHVLHVVGPRPLGVAEQRLWARAAAGVDHYRRRWEGAVRAAEAGERPPGPPPAARLADRLRVARQVEDLRLMLDGTPLVAVRGRERER